MLVIRWEHLKSVRAHFDVMVKRDIGFVGWEADASTSTVP